jgi:hypothetical protein
MPLTLNPLGGDTFSRANENPLSQGGLWTQDTAGDPTLQLVSDVAELTSAVGGSNASLYSGVSLPNDQYASATLAVVVAVESVGYVAIRLTDNGSSFASLPSYVFGIELGGGWRVLYEGSVILSGTTTYSIGDVITIAVVGTTVYAIQNSTQLGSVTNASASSGEAALGGTSNTAITRVQYSNWVVGSAALATYSISGNAGVAGATVSWSGSSTGSTTADGSGNYSITGLSNGSYVVTPSLGGYVFSPTSQNETVNNANISGVNFTATPVSSTPGPTATLTGTQYHPRAVQIFAQMPNGDIAGVSVDSNGNLAVASSGNVNTIDVLGNLFAAVVCVIVGPSSGVTEPGAQGGLIFAAVDTFGNLITSEGSAGSGSPNTTIDLLVDQGVVPVQIFGRLSSTGQLIGVCATTSGSLGNTLNPIIGVSPGGPGGIDTLYPDDGQWPIPILICGRVVAGYSNSGKIVPVALTSAGGLAISGAADASTTLPTVSFNNSVATPIQIYARTSASVLTSVPLNNLGQLSLN